MESIIEKYLAGTDALYLSFSPGRLALRWIELNYFQETLDFDQTIFVVMDLGLGVENGLKI